MIAHYHRCTECNSANIVKNGKNASGSQRYKCKNGISAKIAVFAGFWNTNVTPSM